MTKKVNKKVRLVNYDKNYDCLIEICNDLPWPKYIIHNNMVFIGGNHIIGDVCHYERDFGFCNTLEQYPL